MESLRSNYIENFGYSGTAAVIFIIAICLRFYHLEQLPPDINELTIIFKAREYLYNDYTNFLHGIDFPHTRVFPFVLMEKIGILNLENTRIFSALAGSIASLLPFIAGLMFRKPLSGLAGSLFMSISPFAISFSRYGHLFAMEMLTGGCAILSFFLLYKNNRLSWPSFCLFLCLSLASNFTHVFIWIALAIAYLLLQNEDFSNHNLKAIIFGLLIPSMLFLYLFLNSNMLQDKIMHQEKYQGAHMIFQKLFINFTQPIMISDAKRHMKDGLMPIILEIVTIAILFAGLRNLKKREKIVIGLSCFIPPAVMYILMSSSLLLDGDVKPWFFIYCIFPASFLAGNMIMNLTGTIKRFIMISMISFSMLMFYPAIIQMSAKGHQIFDLPILSLKKPVFIATNRPIGKFISKMYMNDSFCANFFRTENNLYINQIVHNDSVHNWITNLLPVDKFNQSSTDKIRRTYRIREVMDYYSRFTDTLLVIEDNIQAKRLEDSILVQYFKSGVRVNSENMRLTIWKGWDQGPAEYLNTL